ncbi:AAA family ATPase [Sinorhizobium medicae]|nr:AAA family ATPase [Sinorhizobium medicae]
MPSANRIIICAAGGGKTTRIVGEAASGTERALLVTYTRNNEKEIERKLYGLGPAIPHNIEVTTWFSFLLRDLARPYRRVLHDRRIEGLQWEEGRSVPFVPETKTAAHYFAGGRLIYSDKISKFICECDRRSGGAVMRRLAQRFDHIFVDEIQDMAGYDIDILELILKAGIKLTLVGDHRQATLKTNQGKKNSAFGGFNIINKFKAWENAGLAALSYERHTHRCHQHIADLGDRFFPTEPTTKSLNDAVTGHDGVFIVATAQVDAYVAAFAPQVLRFDKKTACRDLPAMNFGESKGLTFDRVMIFPHGLGKKWLSTGQVNHVAKSAAKMYVGATRARYSLAFVHDGAVAIPGAQIYE